MEMYRPEGWKEIKDAIHGKINIDDPYYEGEVDEGIEAGADAMLEKLKDSGTFTYGHHSPDIGDQEISGYWVFIPDEE